MNNTSAIELILRSVQKDTEYSELLNKKFLKLIEEFPSEFTTSLDTEQFEIVSKLTFKFVNYVLRKSKISPGEEYTQLYKHFSNLKSVVSYVIIEALQNYLLRKFHSKIISQIENKLNAGTSILNYRNFLFNKIMALTFINFSNFEDLVEKFEEMQLCLLFLDQNNNSFIQKLFRFGYRSLNKSSQETEIISNSGFKFFGYLILFKLLLQFGQFLLNTHRLYKMEEIKYMKNLEENKLQIPSKTEDKKINIKLKHGQISGEKNTESSSCLLCLDDRRNTALTSCGHLFCWQCITRYLQSNPNCPFCRTECNPQNVIFLSNYI